MQQSNGAQTVSRREEMCAGVLQWVLSSPEMSPAICPCLVTDGAPLSWHGRFGTGAPGEGSLLPSTHLAGDGYHFEDGVKAALLIRLK